MPKRLVYLPIEPYASRYTEYTSVKDGVYEAAFKEHHVPFVCIRPDTHVRAIKTGLVLDALERSKWSFAQVTKLLSMMQDGTLRPDIDAIYIEDFWTPGFEMIPYMQSILYGSNPANHIPVYAFCHAQSTDPHDFTAPWEYWIRGMEQGWAAYLTKIFCAARQMKQQWKIGNMPDSKLQHIGHMFNGKVVQRLSGVEAPDPLSQLRRKDVVFSSRFDTEKNPDFFIAVAHEVLRMDSSVRFIFCTGNPRITSNDPELEKMIYAFKDSYPDNVMLRVGLTKTEYYEVLCNSKVQFNCADQDFISYTLLEATLYGVAPLYPRYLTFPEALNYEQDNLYDKGDVKEAANKMFDLLRAPAKDYSWVWRKYESTSARLLHAMGYLLPANNIPPAIDYMNRLHPSGVLQVCNQQ